MPMQAPDCPALLSSSQAGLVRLILEPERLERLDGMSKAAELLASRGRVAPLVGLAAYVHGYPARLREALADVYEALAAIVGDEEFTELTRRYAAKYRPSSYNLNDAGAQVPRYLVGDPLTTRRPYLPALALLEWKMAEAFHAATLPRLDPAVLAEQSEDEWARATLVLQPSIAILISHWPVLSLWQSHDAARSSSDVPRAAECVLVYRSELVVKLAAIPRAEAVALRALQRGRRLSDVIDYAAAAGAGEQQVGDWFARWQSFGLIAAVAPAKEASR
jgi:hypothetical protein